MKLAASDFDGVIHIDHIVSYERVMEIKAWQKAGNQFVLTSWRDGLSLKMLAHLNGIRPDFMFSNHGAVILDREGHILVESCFQRQTLETLIEIIKQEELEQTIFKCSLLLLENNELNQTMVREQKEVLIDSSIEEILAHPVNEIKVVFSSVEAELAFCKRVTSTVADVRVIRDNGGVYVIAPLDLAEVQPYACYPIYQQYEQHDFTKPFKI
ncbi:MAG: HAD family hydrolase [Erysipelotrichaceae bacterium]